MPYAYILEKDFRFEASHQLIGYKGNCSKNHGHSWLGTLRVRGDELIQLGSNEGMLIDYGDLKEILAPMVEKYLDHHFLNETLETDRPTSEFVAKWVYDYVAKIYRDQTHSVIQSVTIQETCTARCTYGWSVL